MSIQADTHEIFIVKNVFKMITILVNYKPK